MRTRRAKNTKKAIPTIYTISHGHPSVRSPTPIGHRISRKHEEALKALTTFETHFKTETRRPATIPDPPPLM